MPADVPELPSPANQAACWPQLPPGKVSRCWHAALEYAGDGAWDWNIVSGAMFFGPRFKAMLGYDATFAATFDAFLRHVHPDDLRRLHERIEHHFTHEDEAFACDLRIRHQDGEYRWMQTRGQLVERDSQGGPSRMVGTQRDISAMRHAEATLQQQLAETVRLNQQLEGAQVQLVQSEKLAAIGQLAAGVAHEMNTPLGFVSSNFGSLERYARQLLNSVEAYRSAAIEHADRDAFADADACYRAADIDFLKEDLPALLSETREGLERVQRIVRDLKDFARIGEQEWQFADLHHGLDSTLNILRYEIKHKAEVVRVYGDLPVVWCVPSMLNQVFLNLLVNAVHAIPAKGVITVRTRVESDHVCIDIADTGCGIAAEHLDHIFEPFFTTKAAGKGTGLGLSLAQDIVARHHGRIRVSSVEGQGTTFTVELPLTTLNQAAMQAGNPVMPS